MKSSVSGGSVWPPGFDVFTAVRVVAALGAVQHRIIDQVEPALRQCRIEGIVRRPDLEVRIGDRQAGIARRQSCQHHRVWPREPHRGEGRIVLIVLAHRRQADGAEELAEVVELLGRYGFGADPHLESKRFAHHSLQAAHREFRRRQQFVHRHLDGEVQRPHLFVDFQIGAVGERHRDLFTHPHQPAD